MCTKKFQNYIQKAIQCIEKVFVDIFVSLPVITLYFSPIPIILIALLITFFYTREFLDKSYFFPSDHLTSHGSVINLSMQIVENMHKNVFTTVLRFLNQSQCT